MSLHDIRRGKDLRRIGTKMGRAVIAERALAIAKQIVDDGSYKNAIAGIGRMTSLASCCGEDAYWSEKLMFGKNWEYDNLLCWDKTGKHYDVITKCE
jgi:hypothetical protein